MIYVKWKRLDTAGPSGYGVVVGSEEHAKIVREARTRVTFTCPTCSANESITFTADTANEAKRAEGQFRATHIHEEHT